MLEIIKKILRIGMKNNFKYFLKKSFYEAHGGEELKDAKYINIILKALDDVCKRKVKRLIINIPPRNLKSFIVNVAFPAWVLGSDPRKKIISVSYSKEISKKNATDCRNIMKSPWYADIFPNSTLKKGQDLIHRFFTKKNGYFFATSVNASLTGDGGDLIILDDPQNPVDIFSKKYTEKTFTWFKNILSSRLNDRKNGVIIIVMQRLHVNDLCGYLTSSLNHKWRIVSVPMIAEKKTNIMYGNDVFFTMKKNEIINNDRFCMQEIDDIKNECGIYTFSTQYQQNPVVSGGFIIKKYWILRELNDVNFVFEDVILSLDCASHIGMSNDYTAILKIGIYQNKIYIISADKMKLEYPDLKKHIKNCFNEDKIDKIIIEDKSNGTSLIQDLMSETNYNVIKIKPKLSKIARFNNTINWFESGRVVMLNKVEESFIEEILHFPNIEHDDRIDSLSQAVNWINETQKDAQRRKDFLIRSI